MTAVHIDFETRSRAPLRECGLSKYAQDPSTEVLCMAYAVGDEDVRVWTPGQMIPQALLRADEIHAHNAAFERAILKHVLGIDVPVGRFHCTAARAAYAGLPRSLEAVGKTLGLGEAAKDKEGHKLMLQMCKPNAGGRYDNDAGKMERLKEYCQQDVVAERELGRRLPKLPESEIRHWGVDRRINERGVPVDRALCEGAVRILDAANARSQTIVEALSEGAIKTGGQVKKILDFVNRKGVNIDNLQATTIEEVLPRVEDESAAAMLELRQSVASAAVKKYTAALARLEGDDRIREAYMYYGTHTGRKCLTGDHEVLTESGWVRLDDWTGGVIATWDQTERISFTEATALSYDYSGELVHFTHQRFDQLSTPDHEMPCWSYHTGRFQKKPMETLGTVALPYTGVLHRNRESVDADALRVLIMVQADATYKVGDRSIRLKFTKTRKRDRCRQLLRRAGLVYTEKAYGKRGEEFSFSIRARHQPLWLKMFRDKTFGVWLLDCDPQVVFDELEHWDGYRCGPNSIQYCTTNRINAELIQTLAHLSGRAASIVVKRATDKWKNREGATSWADVFYVHLWYAASNRAQPYSGKMERQQFTGRVFCAATTSGFFLVRRNNKVWVTGNSSPGLQIQNLRVGYRGEIPEHVIDMIRLGSIDLADAVNDGSAIGLLGRAVRGIICAPAGKKIVLADISQAEVRIAHWLAGGPMLQCFRDGLDIYIEFAKGFFGTSTVTAEQRKYAKAPVLGAGYGMGATRLVAYAKNYGVDMSPSEAKRTIDYFRKTNAAIVVYWKNLETASKRALQTGKEVKLGKVVFGTEGKWLTLQLPSGRKLYYYDPQLVPGEFGEEFTYIGSHGRREKLWGGTWLENLCQAITRDLCVEAQARCEDAGLSVILDQHDEIGLECDECAAKDAQDELCRIICSPPEWADGLPVGADGRIRRRFEK